MSNYRFFFMFNFQVEVIVNGIPASCQKKMCSFTFSEAMTPRVVSFFPMDGGDKPIKDCAFLLKLKSFCQLLLSCNMVQNYDSHI